MSWPNSLLIASFCLSVNFLVGVGGTTELDAWLDVCCGSGVLGVDCFDAGGGEAIGSLRLSPFLCVSANCLDFAGGAVGADTEDLDWTGAAGDASGWCTIHGDSFASSLPSSSLVVFSVYIPSPVSASIFSSEVTLAMMLRAWDPSLVRLVLTYALSAVFYECHITPCTIAASSGVARFFAFVDTNFRMLTLASFSPILNFVFVKKAHVLRPIVPSGNGLPS